MSAVISGRSPCFLLLCLLLLAFHFPSATAGDLLNAICSNTRNYTRNSTFQANLKLLLASLSSTAPPTGYSNDTVGRGSDRVHGLALCRGDLTEAQCRECLAGAVDGVVKECPYGKSATVWYETCHLRYSDKSFFGSPTGANFYMWNVNNVSDPASFGPLLDGLMDGLTRRAAYASQSRMFAVGDVGSAGGGKIYGLAQCTRDLSAEGCNKCLRDEIAILPVCCNGKQGGRVMGGSCYLRYEVSPFYNTSAVGEQLSPAPAPAPAPPSLLPTPAVPSATPPSAGVASPPGSTATVNKAMLDLPHLLAFFFSLMVFSWEF